MIKSLAVGCLLLVTGGCASFTYCQKIIDTIDSDINPMVYDSWEIQVNYSQDATAFNCMVKVSAIGYVGQQGHLTKRPKRIDGLLK